MGRVLSLSARIRLFSGSFSLCTSAFVTTPTLLLSNPTRNTRRSYLFNEQFSSSTFPLLFMASRNPNALGPTRPRSTRAAAIAAGHSITIQTQQLMGTARNPAPVSPLPRNVCAFCQRVIRARHYKERCCNCNQPLHQLCIDRRVGSNCPGNACRQLLCFQPGVNIQCPYCRARFRPDIRAADIRWRQVCHSQQYHRYKRAVARRIGPDARQQFMPNGQPYRSYNLVQPCPNDFEFDRLALAFPSQIHSMANIQTVITRPAYFLNQREWHFYRLVRAQTVRTAFLLVQNDANLPRAQDQTWHLSRLMFLMHEPIYSQTWKVLREMFDDRTTPIQVAP